MLVLVGCKTPKQYRGKADEVTDKIIDQKQKEALGHTEPLIVERPSDILRRRLLEEQGLPYSSPASLGTDQLEPIPHWPKDDYPPTIPSPDANIPVEPNNPLKLSLLDALQIGAFNSPDYQSRKEDVFRTALALDLERNAFRNIFTAGTDHQIETDTAGDETVTTANNSATAGVTRTLFNGMELSAALSVNLLNLLTQGGAQSLGLAADTTVSMPLLRGAGRWIVTEPLTQAERDVLYQIWEFERFKDTFAVNVASGYFGVLRQMDAVANAAANYTSAVKSARWSRRRGDAGRIRETEVDQAVQRELTARNGWISAQEQLKGRLDAFKTAIGLPTDSYVELDRAELEQLQRRAEASLQWMRTAARGEATGSVPPADAEVVLVPSSREGAGPWEIDDRLAVETALENRLDLRVANGGVYDAQRKVVVAADALRAGLTLGGSASFFDNDDDGALSFEGGRYAALLSLDLPIERTRERNAYRNSLINLERATRDVQNLEDDIKLAIRNELRTLLESRESLQIQAQSVLVAEKRVKSSQLFLEAGRIQIRDLLDAQDSLLSAQNALTRAVIDYRLAELQLQQDMGILEVNEKGLWREIPPEEISHDKAK